jgi:hypothetical protein
MQDFVVDFEGWQARNILDEDKKQYLKELWFEEVWGGQMARHGPSVLSIGITSHHIEHYFTYFIRHLSTGIAH